MQEFSLTPWVSLEAFPPGRLQYAATEVRRRAIRVGARRVVEAADDALETAREQLELERRWAAERCRARQCRPERAVQLEARVDRILHGLHQILCGSANAHATGSERALRAHALCQLAFPRGLDDIVGASFEESLERAQRVLDVLDGESQHDDVAVLGLFDLVENLRAATRELTQSLQLTATGPLVTFDQVDAARGRTHEAWLAVIVVILGGAPDTNIEDVERRTLLLEPIRKQREAIARAHERRRHVIDVDPETGVELDPDAVLVLERVPV